MENFGSTGMTGENGDGDENGIHLPFQPKTSLRPIRVLMNMMKIPVKLPFLHLGVRHDIYWMKSYGGMMKS